MEESLMPSSRKALFGLALIPLLLPLPGGAQERVVVSKEVAVGRSEATLRLEFSDGAGLSLSLKDGSVVVDGDVVGAYASGDALEAAWRALLGEAVALDDGPLSQRLMDWSPPAFLEGDERTLAQTLDEAIDGALAGPGVRSADEGSAPLSVGSPSDVALVRALLGQTSRLAVLGEALRGLGSEISLHVDEDVDVAAGETLTGGLVVVQGDARIAGTVDGDVVVVDGTLELLDGGRVTGDVRLADATLERAGGSIDGDVVDVEGIEGNAESEIREQLRDELRRELREEIRGSADVSAGSGWTLFRPFTRIFSGIGGLVENLVFILVMGVLGLAVLAFAPRNLDVVAETARQSPGRAAMVGLAGTFLLVPVWILGVVALAVSIVGIPVMIAWIPLFPLAALAAVILGYLAVARNVGEWLADSEYRYTDWIRKSNPVTTVLGGVAGLTFFFMVANVLGILPFFGFFKGLLLFAGVLASLAALQVGFGAVLLTRAGQRPEYHPRDFDEAWERAVDMDVDLDPAPSGTGRNGGGDHA
jgi:hypothetical protein